MRRPTSPGSTLAIRKIITDSRKRVTTASPILRSRNLPMTSLRLETSLSKIHLSVARDVDVGDVAPHPGQGVVVVGEDDRRLVEQQLLYLPRQLSLSLQVDRRHVLLLQVVVLGVLEVSRIPGAGAEEGRAQVDVGD